MAKNWSSVKTTLQYEKKSNKLNIVRSCWNEKILLLNQVGAEVQ